MVQETNSKNTDETVLDALEKVVSQRDIVIPGRIVHYHTSNDTCLAAIIVKARTQNLVNVVVFDDLTYGDEHMISGRRSIEYGFNWGDWHWPTECPHLKELVSAGTPL